MIVPSFQFQIIMVLSELPEAIIFLSLDENYMHLTDSECSERTVIY